MRRSLARAHDGKALDEAEALVLLGARGADLERLFVSATRVRDAAMVAAGRPGVVTYSRKVFIPLTRLCRDRCHYCAFATVPHRLPAAYLSPDEVLDIARAGAAQGCKEALFTLGDRPEDRWPEAREWLDAHGYDDTLAYVRAMAIRVLEETGLLPHLNPGVMSWSGLQRLKPVAPSMGMMLETTSRRLFEQEGQAHFGSPDKDPAVRLRVLEDAGRVGIPFTTGILVGIGETLPERLDSILAIRRVAREYGSIQECIVQNFRSKDDTSMRSTPDLGEEEYLATIAVTRLLLGPSVSVQAPPNLSEPEQIPRLLAAGVDDWGGVSPVTPDHVNPERPWPEVDDLSRWTEDGGLRLAERLTTGARYVLGALQRDEPWIDPRLHPHVRALADPETGLANQDARPLPVPPASIPPSGSCHGRPCGRASWLARPVSRSAKARTCGCRRGSIQDSSRCSAPRMYRAPVVSRSASLSPDSSVQARRSSISGQGRSGLTWSGVSGDIPPQSSTPAASRHGICPGSDRFGGACTLTEGPSRSLVTAIVARYSSSPRSGTERIEVSSLDRKFWTMHSWIEPYSRATLRIARMVSSLSRTVSPMPTRMPVVNGTPTRPASSSTRSRTAGSLSGEPKCASPGTSKSRLDVVSSIMPIEGATGLSLCRSDHDITPGLRCGNRPVSSRTRIDIART